MKKLLVIVVLLAACNAVAPTAPPEVTYTPGPTYTPAATYTPRPTATAYPTGTVRPADPTYTPRPTYTLIPTYTPRPTMTVYPPESFYYYPIPSASAPDEGVPSIDLLISWCQAVTGGFGWLVDHTGMIPVAMTEAECIALGTPWLIRRGVGHN